MRRVFVALLLLWASVGAGCGLWRWGGEGVEAPLPDSGVAVVSDEAVASFYQRAQSFYDHIEGRRFNSVTTFRDRFFRDYFQDEVTFSDYYADLASELVDINMKRNRPLFARVEEFLVDGPGSARVRVRIGGKNGLPLRWWKVSTLREDLWERHGGQWWIVSGAG